VRERLAAARGDQPAFALRLRRDSLALRERRLVSPSGLEPAARRYVRRISVSFVDFAAISFEFDRVRCVFGKIVTGAKLLRQSLLVMATAG
jgi:hypothetical protein